MKKKAKKVNVVKTKKPATPVSKKGVALVHAKNPVLKHFKLIEHQYTGKLVHFRHTSHLFLILILVLLGLFLFASSNYAQSYNQASGTVTVGTIVTGSAPTTGATIISPVDRSTIDGSSVIDIKGTCEKKSFVVVRDNGIVIGSTSCTEAGIFSLSAELLPGKNVLSALNYDNLNQSGPVTPSITVFLKKNGVKISTISSAVNNPTIQSLPTNPTTISGLNNNFSDCNSYNLGALPTDDEPHITVVCEPRLFLPDLPQVLGVLVWGGTPPYAVSVDLGNNSNDLMSLPKAGYQTLRFSYAAPNIYKLSFKLKDQAGKTAVIQTSVQVSGTIASSDNTSSSTSNSLGDAFYSSISKAPTPLYLIAVAVTLGFWGGDLYDRKYGSGKVRHRRRKAV